MSVATSIRYPDYAAAAGLGYGRLFTPPPSLAAGLKGAYVPSRAFHDAPLYDWSGNGNALTSVGAALADGVPSLGSAGYLETPVTGQDLIAAGGGTATLIAVCRTLFNVTAQVIGSGGGSGQSIQINADTNGQTKAFSLLPGNWNAAIPAEGRGGCFDMIASTHAINKTQVYRKRPYAQGYLSLTANPAAGDTLTIGGTTITFVASAPTGAQILIGADRSATFANLLAYIAANTALLGVTGTNYVISGVPFLNLTATAKGAAGNSIVLAKSSAGIGVSGATLTGAASSLITATTGGGTTAPIGGTNKLRLGYGYASGSPVGPTQLAFAGLYAGELSHAQLDAAYDELAAQLIDYGVTL